MFLSTSSTSTSEWRAVAAAKSEGFDVNPLDSLDAVQRAQNELAVIEAELAIQAIVTGVRAAHPDALHVQIDSNASGQEYADGVHDKDGIVCWGAATCLCMEVRTREGYFAPGVLDHVVARQGEVRSGSLVWGPDGLRLIVI